MYKFSINLKSFNICFPSVTLIMGVQVSAGYHAFGLEFLLTFLIIFQQRSQGSELTEIAGNNFMEVTFFILSGFSNHPELQVSLFIMFLFIYLITVLGNLALILIIRIDSQLHTPICFFLSNLAFIDIFYSSPVTPRHW